MKFKFLSILFLFPFIVIGCSKSNAIPEGPGDEANIDSSGIIQYPAQVIDLKNWKLTLPVNTEHNGNPDEIKQPELNTYKDQFFTLNSAKNAIVFKAFTGGYTTSGSNYPRSELREMTNNGKSSASWSSSVGKHTLYIDQKVTHLPDVKKHIVIGQIHDASRYVIFFRLEDSKLLVSVNGGQKIILDANYKLGTRFNVMFEVADGKTKCFYNGKLMHTHQEKFEGAYFKAGAYVQSSCKGDKKVEGESCNAYGEVEIFNTWVKHE